MLNYLTKSNKILSQYQRHKSDRYTTVLSISGKYIQTARAVSVNFFTCCGVWQQKSSSKMSFQRQDFLLAVDSTACSEPYSSATRNRLQQPTRNANGSCNSVFCGLYV